MEFASSYILLTEQEEYETISDEELEKGLTLSSDSESESDEEAAKDLPENNHERKKSIFHHWKQGIKNIVGRKVTQPPAEAIETTSAQKIQHRRADTNIVSVNFNTLLLPSNMHAGDPVHCKRCHAVLSLISYVDPDSKVWRCEFCDKSTKVDIDPEEITHGGDVTFLIQPAMTTSRSTFSGVDRSLVVFCMDTSGSMCVTTEISGKIKLRGTRHLRRLQSFNEDQDSQFLPSQTHTNVTYISRLQAMQAAVDHQLDQMSYDHPNRRVALITFNNEVTIVGDGTQDEIVVTGDKLTNEEQLCKIGTEAALPEDIKSSRRVLGKKVYNLEEGGATALGPALVVAVNMAAHFPGSKVILCTDGKANIGLGKLEDTAEEKEALEFYKKVAKSALKKGVTLSVITIGGTDCKLVHLGMLADKTGGTVNTVDPLKLTEEFGNIIAEPVIATRVQATFLLHKELYVIDDMNPDNKCSKVQRNVGNARSSTAITFEFARRHHPQGTDKIYSSARKSCISKENTRRSSSLSVTEELPFQLQIEYTDTEGNQALRVVTRRMPVTTNRDLSEEYANLEVLGLHAAKKSAELALQGQFSKSRSVALLNHRLAWRHSHSLTASDDDRKKYKTIYTQLQMVENTVRNQMLKEILVSGHTMSDSEPSDDDDDSNDGCRRRSLPPKPKPKYTKGFIATRFKMMRAKRSSEMDDGMANMMYRFRGVGASEISSGSFIDETSASGSSKERAGNKASKKKTKK
ncbi:unnamed protein product [Candidula unifasciata]|uniref:VWFA domain-containing protein n=1 Tax=Candidula unifasciata TaxID=100452 RepID=A0A8S3YSC5_9EUPU|nr:unnamed protein product [Candidula unifasciata]